MKEQMVPLATAVRHNTKRNTLHSTNRSPRLTDVGETERRQADDMEDNRRDGGSPRLPDVRGGPENGRGYLNAGQSGNVTCYQVCAGKQADARRGSNGLP